MSVAAVGQPLVKPKKGPKSRVAARPGDVKASDRRLEGFIENGETVDHFEGCQRAR